MDEHQDVLHNEVIRRGGYYLFMEPYRRRAVQLTMWAAASRYSVPSLLPGAKHWKRGKSKVARYAALSEQVAQSGGSA